MKTKIENINASLKNINEVFYNNSLKLPYVYVLRKNTYKEGYNADLDSNTIYINRDFTDYLEMLFEYCKELSNKRNEALYKMENDETAIELRKHLSEYEDVINDEDFNHYDCKAIEYDYNERG